MTTQELITLATAKSESMTEALTGLYPYLKIAPWKCLGISIAVTISESPREEWPNGYIENTNYTKALIHIDDDGTASFSKGANCMTVVRLSNIKGNAPLDVIVEKVVKMLKKRV